MRADVRARLDRLRRARPFPYPRRTVAAATALLYVAGGATTLLVLALPHPDTVDAAVLAVAGVAALVIGLVVWVVRDRVSPAMYAWLPVAGTALITVLVATSGSRSAAVSFSFFYLWVVIYALLFFAPLVAAAHVALAAGAYGAVMVLAPLDVAAPLTSLEPLVLVVVTGATGCILVLLARARELSETDPLTLVANRRGLERLLEHAVVEASRGETALVLAMIDVDHFKQVNDDHGHPAGDVVLQDLAATWRRVLRSDDAFARFGGDEFVALLHATPSEAAIVLERARTAVGPAVTCSIGAASWQPGDSASMLMSRADAALYQAKRLGRDRVAFDPAGLPSPRRRKGDTVPRQRTADDGPEPQR